MIVLSMQLTYEEALLDQVEKALERLPSETARLSEEAIKIRASWIMDYLDQQKLKLKKEG